MEPTRSSQIDLAERRLAWLEARQRVLAENVANADTPGYQPRDVPDFARLLAARGSIALARTDAAHIAPAGDGTLRARPDRLAAERSRNGNAVALDEQAMKIAETDTAHALASGLHHRFLTMIRTALGRT